MLQDEHKPKFGASNPALKTDHEPWGRDVVAWIVGVFVGVLIIYWVIGVIANIAAQEITDKQESVWFSGTKIVNLTGFDAGDGAGVVEFERCKELLAKLKSSPGLRQLPYDIYLSSTNAPNAFAVPGGHILVTKGLLDLVKSDMGLAMVLAHELGHHQFRDPLRGMGRSLSLSLVLSLFMGGESNFVKLVLSFVNSSYSREQENRADRFGFELLYSTFRRTAGAFEFFEKISEHQATKIHELASMLSTHPYTPDRIDALKKLEADIKNREPANP